MCSCLSEDTAVQLFSHQEVFHIVSCSLRLADLPRFATPKTYLNKELEWKPFKNTYIFYSLFSPLRLSLSKVEEWNWMSRQSSAVFIAATLLLLVGTCCDIHCCAFEHIYMYCHNFCTQCSLSQSFETVSTFALSILCFIVFTVFSSVLWMLRCIMIYTSVSFFPS